MLKCKMNGNFTAMPENYLFSTIRQKVNVYQAAHPEQKIVSLGIGDVTQPLPEVVVNAM